MAQLDTLDIVVLVVLLLATLAYITKGRYWAVVADASNVSRVNGIQKNAKSRDILQKMRESEKNCIVFYGSQTGTAEDYAQRLSKEAHSRFGLASMTADLEDYDYDNLDCLTANQVVMFVLATYGEGEPTDNAVDFYEFISGDTVSFSMGGEREDSPLTSVKYVAFGLGNNTYEHYNSVVRNVTKHMDALGANRVGAIGEGDDGAGTMEEDFLAWKEPMWAALAKDLGLKEREAVYEPAFSVEPLPDLDASSDQVYLGEPNKKHLQGQQTGPFNAQNPYIAPIAQSKELFTVENRNCLHVEFDISASNLTYTTGDHVAVWPTNPGREVNRFLGILGLINKRHNVIQVTGIDSTAKVPFPSPSTYDAVVRFHMEICAPISRQFVASLAEFASDAVIKKEVVKIGKDKDYFATHVADKHFNIAQLLEYLGGEQRWTKVPFSLLVEGLHRIQPRYYSISSSSLVNKRKISVTAVVESRPVAHGPNVVLGVTTNYLLALKQKQHGDPHPDPHGLDYALTGPRNKYDGCHVPIHVRHSNFKLPSDPSRPIIMIGPGTGVAPFRAFVQERAMQAGNGETVGKTVLFYGCRKQNEDFLYKDEWKVSHNPRPHHAFVTDEFTSNIKHSWAMPFHFMSHSRVNLLKRSTSNICSCSRQQRSTCYCCKGHISTFAVTRLTWRERSIRPS